LLDLEVLKLSLIWKGLVPIYLIFSIQHSGLNYKFYIYDGEHIAISTLLYQGNILPSMFVVEEWFGF